MPQPGEIETPQTRQPRRAEELHALASAYMLRAWMLSRRPKVNIPLGQMLMERGIALKKRAERIDRDGLDRTP